MEIVLLFYVHIVEQWTFYLSIVILPFFIFQFVDNLHYLRWDIFGLEANDLGMYFFLIQYVMLLISFFNICPPITVLKNKSNSL
jgi:hypothetical protein